MSKKKKYISLLLAIVMIAGLAAYLPGGFITTSAATLESGVCGPDLVWTLDGTTLTISGTGDMNTGIPYNIRKIITKVVIYSRVTSIYNDACSVITAL